MCSVRELLRTLRALDTGKDTKPLRECMADIYSEQRLLREYVAHYPIHRRANRGGVWVRMFSLGLAETPIFIPLGVPFVVWEKSETQTHIEMNEYTLVHVSEFEVPSWVHDSIDLGKIFENWFASAPTEASAALGDSTLVENTLRRGLKSDTGQPLYPRHFLCSMLRKPKCVKRRVNGLVEKVPVAENQQYVCCVLKQNPKYNFFEDGSETFPFTVSRWLKVDQKGGPWEKYPLMLPGHSAGKFTPLCIPSFAGPCAV